MNLEQFTAGTRLTWGLTRFVPTGLTSHFNPDFVIVTGTKPVKDGMEMVSQVCYMGTALASFSHSFEPSEKAAANGKAPLTYDLHEPNTPLGYIRTYGYLAEHTRQSREAIGDPAFPRDWHPNWVDDMAVSVSP